MRSARRDSLIVHLGGQLQDGPGQLSRIVADFRAVPQDVPRYRSAPQRTERFDVHADRHRAVSRVTPERIARNGSRVQQNIVDGGVRPWAPDRPEAVAGAISV